MTQWESLGTSMGDDTKVLLSRNASTAPASTQKPAFSTDNALAVAGIGVALLAAFSAIYYARRVDRRAKQQQRKEIALEAGGHWCGRTGLPFTTTLETGRHAMHEISELWNMSLEWANPIDDGEPTMRGALPLADEHATNRDMTSAISSQHASQREPISKPSFVTSRLSPGRRGLQSSAATSNFSRSKTSDESVATGITTWAKTRNRSGLKNRSRPGVHRKELMSSTAPGMDAVSRLRLPYKEGQPWGKEYTELGNRSMELFCREGNFAAAEFLFDVLCDIRRVTEAPKLVGTSVALTRPVPLLEWTRKRDMEEERLRQAWKSAETENASGQRRRLMIELVDLLRSRHQLRDATELIVHLSRHREDYFEPGDLNIDHYEDFELIDALTIIEATHQTKGQTTEETDRRIPKLRSRLRASTDIKTWQTIEDTMGTLATYDETTPLERLPKVKLRLRRPPLEEPQTREAVNGLIGALKAEGRSDLATMLESVYEDARAARSYREECLRVADDSDTVLKLSTEYEGEGDNWGWNSR